MLASIAARATFAATLLAVASMAEAACPDPSRGLGVARIVEVDTTGGPVFGFITKQAREKSFLGPREVVLTFDDGPMPGITRSILDTLDQFCTKATFFSVGRMAAAYPDSVREILKRGHTLGTHTWSHPMSLPRLSQKQAKDQIESGFAAVSNAAGQPIAPFFRFPGLNDSAALIKHLEERNIATFTVDVVSNDSYITDVGRLTSLTLERLEAENGGIMLFHDIKHQTARALPGILAEMRRRGYKVVHLTTKHAFQTDPAYSAAVAEQVAAKKIGPQRPALVAIVDTPKAPAPAIEKVEEPVAPPAAPRVAPVVVADNAAPSAPTPTAPAAPQPAPAVAPEAVSSPPPPAQDRRARIAARHEPASTPPPITATTPATVEAPAVRPPAAVTVEPSVATAPASAAKAPKPTSTAPVAVAQAKPAPTPQAPAVKPKSAAPQVEVVAGAYPSKPPAGVPVIIPAGPTAPTVVAGSYAQTPAAPKRTPRSWQDNLSERLRESGN